VRSTLATAGQRLAPRWSVLPLGRRHRGGGAIAACPHRSSLGRRDPCLACHPGLFQRADRGRQPADQKGQAGRAWLPQLRQLPPAAAAALRRHVADFPDREIARPLTTLGGVEPCRIITSQHGWRWSCRMVTARQRAASATGTTPNRAIRRSCMASTPGWCRLTSSGPVVVSPAILRADTAPNHPMRVRTTHPGWAHAGRQPVGWAKGARSWRTPRGSRTPPRRTATAIGSVEGAMA
jgi:hypothetical protein